MSHHTQTATPQNDFQTLTAEELACVDGGFVQMLGALLNIAGPLISQFANKGGQGGGQGQSQRQGDQRQGGDGSQGGDPRQAQQGAQSDGGHGSAGGGFNLGSLLGMFGGGMLGGGK